MCPIRLRMPWWLIPQSHGSVSVGKKPRMSGNRNAVYMGVSLNGGTPKSSILIRFSVMNHPFWGTTIFGNTHIVTIGKSTAGTSPQRVTEADGSDDVHFSFVHFFQWCLGCLSWIFGYVFLKQSAFFFGFWRTSKKSRLIQIVHIKKTFFPIHHLWLLLFWYWKLIYNNRHFHTRGQPKRIPPRRTSKKRRKALPPLPPMPPPPPPPLALEDGEVRCGELRWQDDGNYSP